MSREVEDGIVSNNLVISTSYLRWYDHTVEYIKHFSRLVVIYFFAALLFLWGVLEASAFFFVDRGLNDVAVLIFGACASGVVGVTRTIQEYRSQVPEALERENSSAQDIAISKRPFWEYALARQLLLSRTEEIDKKLEHVLGGRTYVAARKQPDNEEYISWLKCRPENVLRLFEVTKQLLVFDLLPSISNERGKENYFVGLISTVSLVQDVYEKTLEFEIGGREIIPPDGFERIHEIQSGWATPIRDGIHQMLDALAEISERTPKDEGPMHSTLKFSFPESWSEEFSAELARIERDVL